MCMYMYNVCFLPPDIVAPPNPPKNMLNISSGVMSATKKNYRFALLVIHGISQKTHGRKGAGSVSQGKKKNNNTNNKWVRCGGVGWVPCVCDVWFHKISIHVPPPQRVFGNSKREGGLKGQNF